MATYDQGQPIKNADVVTLLANINTVMARTGGMDKSSFDVYRTILTNNSISPSTSVSANVGTSATSAQAAGLRIIQHLLKNGYMNVSSTQQAAATALINQAYPDAGTSMVALTNAYTVVNYWNTGNSEASHTGCNGACVGYCTGSCGGTATSAGTTSSSSGTTGCTCGSACGTGCSTNCKGTCTGSSGGDNQTSCGQQCGGGCSGFCYNSCKNACKSGCVSCNNSCKNKCKNGCNTACSTACNTACSGCSSGCGSSCLGTCTFASSSH